MLKVRRVRADPGGGDQPKEDDYRVGGLRILQLGEDGGWVGRGKDGEVGKEGGEKVFVLGRAEVEV